MSTSSRFLQSEGTRTAEECQERAQRSGCKSTSKGEVSIHQVFRLVFPVVQGSFLFLCVGTHRRTETREHISRTCFFICTAACTHPLREPSVPGRGQITESRKQRKPVKTQCRFNVCTAKSFRIPGPSPSFSRCHDLFSLCPLPLPVPERDGQEQHHFGPYAASPRDWSNLCHTSCEFDTLRVWSSRSNSFQQGLVHRWRVCCELLHPLSHLFHCRTFSGNAVSTTSSFLSLSRLHILTVTSFCSFDRFSKTCFFHPASFAEYPICTALCGPYPRPSWRAFFFVHRPLKQGCLFIFSQKSVFLNRLSVFENLLPSVLQIFFGKPLHGRHP